MSFNFSFIAFSSTLIFFSLLLSPLFSYFSFPYFLPLLFIYPQCLYFPFKFSFKSFFLFFFQASINTTIHSFVPRKYWFMKPTFNNWLSSLFVDVDIEQRRIQRLANADWSFVYRLAQFVFRAQTLLPTTLSTSRTLVWFFSLYLPFAVSRALNDTFRDYYS